MADESWRDESWRERTKDFLYPYLKSYQGLSPTTQELSEAEKEAQAQQTIRRIFGSSDPELESLEGLGWMDLTPVGFAFGVDDAIREAGEAERGLDYIFPAVGLGLSAVEAYPLTKVMSKPVIGFLKNLFSKSTSAPIDKAKRETIAGMAAVPVAGALSNIPVNKIIDDVAPIVKKVIPKNAFEIPIFRRALDNEIAKDLLSGEHGIELKELAEENLDEALEMIDTDQELKVMRDSYYWFRGGKKGDPPNDFAKQMDAEYPDANSDEIANVIGDSNQAGLDVWQESQEIMGRDSPGFSEE